MVINILILIKKHIKRTSHIQIKEASITDCSQLKY